MSVLQAIRCPGDVECVVRLRDQRRAQRVPFTVGEEGSEQSVVSRQRESIGTTDNAATGSARSGGWTIPDARSALGAQ